MCEGGPAHMLLAILIAAAWLPLGILAELLKNYK
jgi:hypothetical protein